MVHIPIQQFDFTAGVLDTSVEARKDLQRYYKGCRQGTNMIMRSIGGLDDRGGLGFVAELSDAGDGCALARFEFSNVQVYLFAFVDQKLHIFKDDELQTGSGVTTPWPGSVLDEIDWHQALDYMIVAHDDYQTRSIVRQGSHTSWAVNAITFANQPTLQTGDDTTNTGTPAATTGSSINFTAGGNEFVAGDVGKWIVGNQGRAEITGFTSATVVVVTIHQDFKDTSAIPAGDWTIEEEVWNSSNGWPRSVYLQEGRMLVGGSKTFLNTGWMSRSGKPFDFKVTYEALDDEAKSVTLDGQQIAIINRVGGLTDPVFLTSGGIYVAAPAANEALTPETFLPRKHDPLPVARLRAVEIEGALGLWMADERGQVLGLHEVIWNEGSQVYSAQDLSVLSSDLVRGPIDGAARRGRKEINSATHVFQINGDDGTCAVFHSRRKQEVAGWTLWTTPGNSGTDTFQRCAVVGNDAYFLVKRTINGNTKYYLEKQVPGRFFHSSIDRPAAFTITGATKANPVVITADNTLDDGETVYIEGVEGMTELNGRTFTVANRTDTTFELSGEDGTGHTTYTSGGTVKFRTLGGLPHLNGETVKVWADGALRDDAVVASGRISITDGGEAIEVSAVEAGLPFNRIVETMPLEGQLSNGTAVGSRHRIIEAIVKVRNAYSVKINGRPASFRKMATMTLDTGPEAFTGELRVRPGGWKGRKSGDATVLIESDLPLPMGVESVTAKVSG